jgi:hypothetical protein
VNTLYDHGADLVEAAAALRESAAEPDAASAAPAVMGCIETALRHLTAATEALERATSTALGPVPEGRLAGRHARMRHGFTNLEVALHDAADAAAAARGLAARALEARIEDEVH